MIQKINILSLAQLVESPAHMAIRVHFGKPSDDCEKLGICFIESRVSTPAKASTPLDDNWADAFIQNDSRGTHFYFVKSSMNANTLKKHFSNNYFIILESITLARKYDPSEEKSEIAITAGEYHLYENDELYYILL